MSSLSNTIERKFTDSISLDDWEIETDSGWEDLSAIHLTVPYLVYEIRLENGMFLKGADNHIVILENGEECFLKDLIPNQSVVKTSLGSSLCIKVENLNYEEEMYDPEVNSKSHLYYSNGILSHNTITIGAYLLWEVIFNKDITIAILANNASKSIEILSRIKMIYEELPFWLKPGIEIWNRGSVEFSNGSKIIALPTTSSSLRGYSINIVYLDEFAFVEKDVEFWTASYPVVVSGKKTKIIISSTPNGMNLFYKIFTDSVNKRNEFVNLLYTWEANPNRDEKWKQETIRNTSEKQFSQEHRLPIFWFFKYSYFW